MIEENVVLKNKNRHPLRMGALILVIIIVIVLFKFNFEKVIDSTNFNENVSYLEQKGKDLWIYLSSGFIAKGLDIKAPVIDPSVYDKAIKPDNIRNYFKIPSEETVNQMSLPISN